jgi:hypothetical protein
MILLAAVAGGPIQPPRVVQPLTGQPARIDGKEVDLIRHITEVACQLLARSSRQQMEVEHAAVGIQLGQRRKGFARPEAAP